MNDKETFLLEEYKTAAHLTCHIDELRNRLTGFFLTFTGLAVAGLALLLKGETTPAFFGSPEGVVAILLFIITVIGFAVIAILARLRKVQIEHFRIINNIRRYFLKDDYTLWNIVQLSDQTLPMPNKKSGSYFWLAIIMLVSSFMFATAVYISIVHIFKIVCTEWGYVIFLLTLIVGIFMENRIYFKLALPPTPMIYSQDNLPF
jgi:hypothetical protein